jgi:hypothetical protein
MNEKMIPSLWGMSQSQGKKHHRVSACSFCMCRPHSRQILNHMEKIESILCLLYIHTTKGYETETEPGKERVESRHAQTLNGPDGACSESYDLRKATRNTQINIYHELL